MDENYIKLCFKALEDVMVLKENDIFGSSHEQINKSIENFQLLLSKSPENLNHIEVIQNLNIKINENSEPHIKYVAYLCHIISVTSSQINFIDLNPDDELTNIKLKLLLKGIILFVNVGIKRFIVDDFHENQIKSNRNLPELNSRYEILHVSNKFLIDLFVKNSQLIKTFPEISTIILYIFYGTFSMMYMVKYEYVEDTGRERFKSIRKDFERFLNILEIDDCFRRLMMMQSKLNLRKELKMIVSNELTNLLIRPTGLKKFIKIITESLKTPNSTVPTWKNVDIVMKIVCVKGRSERFFTSIVDQSFEFLTMTKGESDTEFTPVFVAILNQIYGFGFQDKIQHILFDPLNSLVKPNEILAGVIVMNDDEFKNTINLLHTCFCCTSMCSLKSDLLIPYLRVLFKMYSMVPRNTAEKLKIGSLLVQCLSNREKSKLEKLVMNLLNDTEVSDEMSTIHPRVKIELAFQRYSIKIDRDDSEMPIYYPHMNLIELLRNSNHNIFIYNVFLVVLKQLDVLFNGMESSTKSDLLCDGDDLELILFEKYNKRLTIINTLNELVNIKSFHTQFSENPDEILDFIKSFLERQLQAPDKINDDLLLVVFSLFQIFAHKINHKSKIHEIVVQIKKLRKFNLDEPLLHQIDSILNETDERHGDRNKNSPSLSEFNEAMKLCEGKEPYVIVNGLNNLIKLIEKRDNQTLGKKHEILLLTIRILKNNEESYTYLNCIKLLTKLSSVFESEVIDTLIAEFQNDQNDVDFRLKVGEVIIKVTESIGPMSYNHKDILISCFMIGARNETDEVRASSLSNLGAICRLLSYQIHHFFNELLQLIEVIILQDKYMPVRRAAVMILSQLLAGMENLLDFQDYLLPIYRALKHVIQTDTDETTRMHAAIGLETLKTKTKDALFAKPKLEKEIKIMGIKDDEDGIQLEPGGTKNPKIIELN